MCPGLLPLDSYKAVLAALGGTRRDRSGEGIRLAVEEDLVMWQRHEYLSGSKKVDRHW